MAKPDPSSIEVVGSTTSPAVGVGSARNQLELITLLPVLYGNGLATCFPCPPDLFVEIIHVNHLRSRFRGAAVSVENNAITPIGDRCSASLAVLRRIRAFQTNEWAAEVTFGSTTDCIGFDGWRAIGDIYKSAVAIYCIASLLHDTCDGSEQSGTHQNPGEVLARARDACRSVLLGRLRVARANTRLRKLVLWPLVVAGVEADDDETKHLVSEELKWISTSLGTAAPLVAKDFLEKRAWGLERARRGCWDDLFDQTYVFVL